jgi:hypothetical protein
MGTKIALVKYEDVADLWEGDMRLDKRFLNGSSTADRALALSKANRRCTAALLPCTNRTANPREPASRPRDLRLSNSNTVVWRARAPGLRTGRTELLKSEPI